MAKYFNVTGLCIPEKHYMANISAKVQEITKTLIDKGEYLTISKARQYGKTTTLYMLEKELQKRYLVLSLSFEAADDLFVSIYTLTTGLVRRISRKLKFMQIDAKTVAAWEMPLSKDFSLEEFSDRITGLCAACEKDIDKEIILMIDEADKNSDNQVFLSFLGLLRAKYLEQQKGQDRTFKSVILAGIYDIKNLKFTMHPGEQPKYNSPWNIAADFKVDLGLGTDEITGMLGEYESSHRTGMDTGKVARLIYKYTSGYPYLVSKICKLIDEESSHGDCLEQEHSAWMTDEESGHGDCPEQEHFGWNGRGVAEAVKAILKTPNTLFDDMLKKVTDYPKLKKMLYAMLFYGKTFPFSPANHLIAIGSLFGFIKEEHGQAAIANRIFETFFYDLFLSEDVLENRIYGAALELKNQFTEKGFLDMELVLQKFMEHYEEIYHDSTEQFAEENGRRLFLLYLKPIINGTGNYYIESRTRSMGRTDVIVDYLGQQYIIEMKIWRGNEYNRRGEEQLTSYLEDYHLKKGYLISFCFHKNKKTGKKTIRCGDKTIIEIIL